MPCSQPRSTSHQTRSDPVSVAAAAWCAFERGFPISRDASVTSGPCVEQNSPARRHRDAGLYSAGARFTPDRSGRRAIAEPDAPMM